MVKKVFGYPGGKGNMLGSILPILLRFDSDTYISPFIGGGAVEIALANRGKRVIAADANTMLVNVWNQIIKNRTLVSQYLASLSPMTRSKHKVLRESLPHLPPVEQAATFIAVINTTFGCKVDSSYAANKGDNLIPRARRIANMVLPDNLSVECMDFTQLLSLYPDIPAYCDPPYLGSRYKTLYGKYSTIDHETLANILVNRSAPWLLSYNDSQQVRELYQGCKIRKVRHRYRLADGNRYSGQGELLIKSD